MSETFVNIKLNEIIPKKEARIEAISSLKYESFVIKTSTWHWFYWFSNTDSKYFGKIMISLGEIAK